MIFINIYIDYIGKIKTYAIVYNTETTIKIYNYVSGVLLIILTVH